MSFSHLKMCPCNFFEWPSSKKRPRKGDELIRASSIREKNVFCISQCDLKLSYLENQLVFSLDGFSPSSQSFRTTDQGYEIQTTKAMYPPLHKIKPWYFGTFVSWQVLLYHLHLRCFVYLWKILWFQKVHKFVYLHIWYSHFALVAMAKASPLQTVAEAAKVLGEWFVGG